MLRSVLFFADTPHRMGGAQRSLLAQLSVLPRHGIAPIVVFPAAGRMLDEAARARLETVLLPAPEPLLRYEQRLLALGPLEQLEVLVRHAIPYSRALVRLARSRGASAIHFNGLRGLVVGGLAARASGLRVVLHQHGLPLRRLGPTVSALMLLADRIVLVSGSLRSAFPGFLHRRFVTIQNGLARLPPHTREEGRRALAQLCEVSRERLDATPVIVTLSTLTPWKGLHHLVTALAMLRARGAPLRWVMLGPRHEPEYTAHLERRVAEAGLSSLVHAPGYRDDATRLLAGADLFVLPTVSDERLDFGRGSTRLRPTEGLPMSLLEALALGIPCVATDVAGVTDALQEGVNGRLVRPSDPEALAAAIAGALGDPSLAERVRREGPALVRSRFLADVSGAKLAALLLGLP